MRLSYSRKSSSDDVVSRVKRQEEEETCSRRGSLDIFRNPSWRRKSSDSKREPGVISSMGGYETGIVMGPNGGRKHSYSIGSKSSEYSAYASSAAPTVASDYTAITSPTSSIVSGSISRLQSSLSAARQSASRRLSKEHEREPKIAERTRAMSEDTYRPTAYFEDDLSSSPKKHHIPSAKKIKPFLKIAKTHGRSSSTSLDLSQPGGGEHGAILGLGIYSDSFGYDSDDAYIARHKRNMSATSGASIQSPTWGNSTYAHPMRQVPRTYTSSPAYSIDNSDDEDDTPSHYVRPSIERTRPPVPTSLRLRTDSSSTPPPTGTTSPVTPLIIQSPIASISTRPPPSPSYEASLAAAREKWEHKEAKKEAKAEKKRRKSEGVDRDMNSSEPRSSATCVRFGPASYAPAGVSPTYSSSVLATTYTHASPVPPSPVASQTDLSSHSAPKRKLRIPGVHIHTHRSDKERKTSFQGGASYSATLPRRKGSMRGKGVKGRWMRMVVWVKIKWFKIGRGLKGKKSKRWDEKA